MHGFGRVVTPDGQRSHHEPWELRAQVLGLLSGSASRPSIEALEPATYLSSSYYVRWLLAAETTLVRRGQLDVDELARWREIIAADADAELPVGSDPDAVAFIRGIGPHSHERAPTAAFAAGDRVRVRRMRLESHHRCPRYVRGAVGTIEKLLGSDPVPGLPDGEQVREPCYTVQFSSVDLFGDATDRGEPPHAVLIDLWERYLEGVA
jgi:nitrile hydratase